MARYSFTNRLIDYANVTATGMLAKAWLLENAPKMNRAQKIEADRAVVMALAKRYEVEPHESKRGVLSGFTLGSGSTAPGQALKRARDILLVNEKKVAAQHVDPVERAAKMLARLTPTQAQRALKRAEALR